MTSNYQDVYSRFLNKISDYEFAGLAESDASAMMLSWLQASFSQPYIYRIFGSFSADDEIAEFNYELSNSVNDYMDKNFVEELLSHQMVVEWLEPRVNNTTLLNQMISNSKEAKWFSQAQHISELRSSLDDAKDKVRSMLRDRGYIYNSYLGTANG